MSSQAGKGDSPRPYNPTAYAAGWDLIWGNRGKSQREAAPNEIVDGRKNLGNGAWQVVNQIDGQPVDTE